MNKTNLSVPPNFPILRDLIYDFIRVIPYPAHVKESKTGKYTFTNEMNLNLYGLEFNNQLIGTTVHDLDELMRPRWDNTYAVAVENLDQQVYLSKMYPEDPPRRSPRPLFSILIST